jgi:hypothetical protein
VGEEDIQYNLLIHCLKKIEDPKVVSLKHNDRKYNDRKYNGPKRERGQKDNNGL